MELNEPAPAQVSNPEPENKRKNTREQLSSDFN